MSIKINASLLLLRTPVFVNAWYHHEYRDDGEDGPSWDEISGVNGHDCDPGVENDDDGDHGVHENLCGRDLCRLSQLDHLAESPRGYPPILIVACYDVSDVDSPLSIFPALSASPRSIVFAPALSSLTAARPVS